MGKLTDGFFKFPAKIYDKKEIGDMVHEFQKSDPDPDKLQDPSWAKGWVRIPFSEIKGWSDDSVNHKSVKELAAEGHDAVYVSTYSSGNFECLWDLAKFEQKLNEAYDVFEIAYPDSARERQK